MKEDGVPTAEDLLEDIESTIADNDILRDSPGVAGAQEAIKSAKDVDFEPVNAVLKQMTESVNVYASDSSSAVDIVSTTLKLTSSVLKVATLIPGAATIARPLSLVLGLAGAVTGAFGSSKESNFAEQMEKMLEDANDKLKTDLANAALAGALSEMKNLYWNVNRTLGKGDRLGTIDYRVKDLTGMATYEAGSTLDILRDQACRDHAANWGGAAETFYRLSQVLAFKTMFLLQVVALFDLRRGDWDGRHSAAEHVLDYLNTQFKSELHDLDPYFLEPDLDHAGITLRVYSLAEEKFRLIGGLFVFANAPEKVFWPAVASQYRFKVEGSDKKYIRVSTIYDYYNKDKRHVLKSRSRQVPDGTEIENGVEVTKYVDVQYYELSRHDRTSSDSYLSLWADTDDYRPQPYYRWTILPKAHRREASNCHLRLFVVKPSEAEREKYNIPKTDRTLLLAGSFENPGYAWRAKHGDEMVHEDDYANLSEKHPGDRWLWILLDRDED